MSENPTPTLTLIVSIGNRKTDIDTDTNTRISGVRISDTQIFLVSEFDTDTDTGNLGVRANILELGRIRTIRDADMKLESTRDMTLHISHFT